MRSTVDDVEGGNGHHHLFDAGKVGDMTVERNTCADKVIATVFVPVLGTFY